MGEHDRPLHGEILKIVRFEVLSILRKEKPYWKVEEVSDEHMSSMMTNRGDGDGIKLLGSQLPGLILFSELTEEYVIIEVGDFNPDKWDESLPVIHIGFNGRVSQVNTRQSILEKVLISLIKEQVWCSSLTLKD